MKRFFFIYSFKMTEYLKCMVLIIVET